MRRADWGAWVMVATMILAATGCAGGIGDLVFDRGHPRGSLTWRAETALPAGADGTLTIVAVGDTGEHEAGSPKPSVRRVAKAAQSVCGGRCDATLFAGDNLYDTGIRDAEARRGFLEIAKLYSWAGPQYYVLGNHDWHYLRPTQGRAREELRLIADNADTLKMRGRAHFWGADMGGMGTLWGLDTNYMVHRCRVGAAPAGNVDCGPGFTGDLLQRMQVQSKSGWRIALGHHPVLSDGPHGDAGDFRDKIFRLWPGTGWRAFADRYLVDTVDLYVAGHDHGTQLFVAGGQRTGLLVAGAGAKHGKEERQPRTRLGVTTVYTRHAALGFALIEVSRKRLTVTTYLVTKDGPPVRTARITKAPGGTWKKGP